MSARVFNLLRTEFAIVNAFNFFFYLFLSQHIIYLLCRTQALLIPSYGELQHLAALIGNVYLKSSHCFIRIAALEGLLCLLECCSRTNTAIGKLSDELTLLRDLIVGYINRHGIIDER